MKTIAKYSKQTYDINIQKDGDGILLNFYSKITGESEDYLYLDYELIAKINTILLKVD